MNDARPDWDPAFAERLNGSLVLVGITYEEPDGTREEQFFGHVVRADAEGIWLRLSGDRSGETYRLPPDPHAFDPAESGSYRLRSTGQVVEDPDFTATWTITPGKG